MLRSLTPVIIRHNLALIFSHPLRIVEIFNIVINCKDDRVCHQTFFDKIKYEQICHLPHDQPAFFVFVRPHQHLPLTEAVILRNISLHIGHSDRLPTPGVIDKQLRIHTEKPPKERLAVIRILGAQCDISHCVHPVRRKLLGISASDTPEIGNRPVAPQLLPISHLVKFRDSHPVGIGLCVLRFYIHSHLSKI